MESGAAESPPCRFSSLRVGLRRENLGVLLCELKSQQPFARRVVPVHLWRSERPPPRNLHCLIPKKLAGKIVQIRFGNFSAVIDVYFYAHANGALYRVS